MKIVREFTICLCPIPDTVYKQQQRAICWLPMPTTETTMVNEFN